MPVAFFRRLLCLGVLLIPVAGARAAAPVDPLAVAGPVAREFATACDRKNANRSDALDAYAARVAARDTSRGTTSSTRARASSTARRSASSGAFIAGAF